MVSDLCDIQARVFFGGGGGREQWGESWEVWFVEIELGRFLSKYQCWGKWGSGVGGYRFIYVGESLRKSIIPKGYLCGSEKTGFCDFRLMKFPSQCLFWGRSGRVRYTMYTVLSKLGKGSEKVLFQNQGWRFFWFKKKIKKIGFVWFKSDFFDLNYFFICFPSNHPSPL